MATEPNHISAARHLLESYDAFMAGVEMDQKDTERFKAVCAGISFGAAAYEAGHGHQAAHAMGRSFLLAIIDPTHPDLDYLRADPKSGEVARLISSDLQAIVDPKEPPVD